MSTNSTLPSLPNPFTPLAFLPPTLAAQYQASIYICIATLSAFIWDWLMSIPAEIEMVRKRKFRLPMVAYFLSRLGALGCCTLICTFLAVPVARCDIVLYAIGGSFIVVLPSTSALFFFRVRAVYANNRAITAFFGFLLFALFGLSFITPLVTESTHIGPTKMCITTKIKPYGFAPAVLNFVLDALVFISISLRISYYSIEGDTFRARMTSFFRGDGLPRLSRSILQGGQLYYSVTIGVNLVVLILAFSPTPQIYHMMFITPKIALESSMACRVFRGIKLGTIEDVSGDTSKVSTLRFRRRPHGSRSAVTSFPCDSAPEIHRGFRSRQDGSDVIDLTKAIRSGESDLNSERKQGSLPECHDGRSSEVDTSRVVFGQV